MFHQRLTVEPQLAEQLAKSSELRSLAEGLPERCLGEKGRRMDARFLEGLTWVSN